MQIKIEITNPSADLLRLIANASGHAAALVQATAPEAPAAAAAAADDGNEAPTVAADSTLADALIAKLDQQFARAKTVTLRGGVQGKEGVYVTTEDGNEGLIVAVYRGRAVITFEDGTAAEAGASTLTLVPDTPDDAAEAEAPQPEAPAATSRRRRNEAPENALLAEAAALAAKVGAKFVGEILAEFGLTTLEKITEMDEADQTDFIQILREEAQA